MKKRRVAALFLAAVMCGGLTACGSGSEAETTAAAAAAETQAAEAPEENFRGGSWGGSSSCRGAGDFDMGRGKSH